MILTWTILTLAVVIFMTSNRCISVQLQLCVCKWILVFSVTFCVVRADGRLVNWTPNKWQPVESDIAVVKAFFFCQDLHRILPILSRSKMSSVKDVHNLPEPHPENVYLRSDPSYSLTYTYKRVWLFFRHFTSTAQISCRPCIYLFMHYCTSFHKSHYICFHTGKGMHYGLVDRHFGRTSALPVVTMFIRNICTIQHITLHRNAGHNCNTGNLK